MRNIILLLSFLISQTILAQPILFAAKEKGKLYGYIDEQGQYIIPPAFNEAGPFYHDIAVVKKGKKYGVINRKGEWIVTAIYDQAIDYAPEGKITVKSGGHWGVIDASGKTIIPFQYPYLSVFKGGYVVGGMVISGKRFKGRICPFVLNEKADTVFRQEDCYDAPSFLLGTVDKKGDYSMGGWPMVREGKLILDRPGEGYNAERGEPSIVYIPGSGTAALTDIVISDDYYGFREGRLAARMKSDTTMTAAFIDSARTNLLFDYKTAFDVVAENAHPFFNGVAAIEKAGKWAFVDRDGWLIAETNLSVNDYGAYPPMYFNGLIGFFKNQLAGYVDVKGNVVIPFQFEEYHPFEYDVTPVKYKGLYGLLRKDGTWAVQPKFENLYLSPCPCFQ